MPNPPWSFLYWISNTKMTNSDDLVNYRLEFHEQYYRDVTDSILDITEMSDNKKGCRIRSIFTFVTTVTLDIMLSEEELVIIKLRTPQIKATLSND